MAVTWPEGLTSSGGSCGIKADGVLDLGVLVADEPVEWAGTFTRNAAAAACVDWSRDRHGRQVRAVVVNSGNANACTGSSGDRAVRATAEAAAMEIGCTADEILIASTGPIGVALPVDRLIGALPNITADLSADPTAFSKAILTTDTATKVATAGAGDATIVGVAKGAAMCAPNMATMLAFIGTDAELHQGGLQQALSEAVDLSFNRISVDGCESTNDSVLLLSTGKHSVQGQEFITALTEVCRDLALAIVRDAEGGHRLVRIQITGAPNDAAAVTLGRAIADSALWRSAVFGADPNWGRVLSAMGTVQRDLSLGAVTLAIGSELVFDKGEPVGSLEAAAKEMNAPEFTVHCAVGSGSGEAEVLSADLSPEYVTLNAEGTS